MIEPMAEFEPVWLLGDELRVEPEIKLNGVVPDDGPELFPPELEATSPNTPPPLCPCRFESYSSFPNSGGRAPVTLPATMIQKYFIPPVQKLNYRQYLVLNLNNII